MEWPKLKNIIILILALVNIFLLAVVGLHERGTAENLERAIADTISVLDRNGIKIDKSNIPAELDLTPMKVERDPEAEALLAETLLGECEVRNLGSGRYAYQSAKGTAEFRSNGNFTFAFAVGALQTGPGETAADYARNVLEKGGFSGALVSQEGEGGRTSLTLCQTWQEVLIYSCRVTLVYEEDCLMSVVGQRLTGTPEPENDRMQMLSVPTAMLKILNGINDMGDICNEITSMTPGYELIVSGDTGRMVPVWHVTTDTGMYSLNAVTGELERM